MAATTLVKARWRSMATAVVLALATGGPTLAQTRLYVLTSGDPGGYECVPASCRPGRLIQLDLDRRLVEADTPISRARTSGWGPIATPDGRYLLWSGSDGASAWDDWPMVASLFDLASRWQSTVFEGYSTYLPIVVHPSRMRAFLGLSRSGPITVAEPGTSRPLSLPPCSDHFLSAGSGDGSRLSIRCLSPPGEVVVDSDSGRVIGATPQGSISIAENLLDDNGSQMFTIDWYPPARILYRRSDVVTGATLAERVTSPGEFTRSVWAFDRQTSRLFAGTKADILVMDAATLQPVGVIAGPHPALYPSMALDPDRPEAYVVWSGQIDGRYLAKSARVDTRTLAVVEAGDLAIDSPIVGIAVGPRPPRTSNLRAAVVGRSVTLDWTLEISRSIATEQAVEVGLTPGQTAVRLPLAVGATSLTVAGAPPGRYYVRVRSGNDTGPGPPSNEVVVDVQ